MFFNIRDFGAAADGIFNNSQAIQSAIDACAAAGGGTVLIPRGSYMTGAILLKDNVTLELAPQALVLGSQDLADYPLRPSGASNDVCGIVCAAGAANIGLRGRGCIDGRGAVFTLDKPRPRVLHFVQSRGIHIREVTLKNSASWCSHLVECDDLHIDSVTIDSRVNASNDGFDIDGCENVFIANCHLQCGDDAFALKSYGKKPCRNIVITNCVIQSNWAAFRFGPESTANFENIAVSNCVIHDTYGGGIKLQMTDGAAMRNITFDNIVMENVTSPISMRLGRWIDGGGRADYAQLPMGTFSNVMISNIRATVVPEPPGGRHPGEERACIHITGIPGHNIEGITLNNVHVTYPGGGTREEAARRDIPELENQYPEYFMFGVLPSYGLYARHARGLNLHNVRLDLASPDMRPAIVCDDVEDLVIDGLRAAADVEMESLLRLRNTRRAFIRHCWPVGDVMVFARLEGLDTQGIGMHGNLLAPEILPIFAADGAIIED